MFNKMMFTIMMFCLLAACGSSSQPMPAEVEVEVSSDSSESDAVAEDSNPDQVQVLPESAGDIQPAFSLNNLVGIYGGGQIMIDDDVENFAQHQLALDFLTHSNKKQITITISINGSSLYLKGDWPENNSGLVLLYSRTYDMSCVINNAGQLLNDRIINMICDRANTNYSYTGYQYRLSETNNGVFVANAENFYSTPTAMTDLSNGEPFIGLFADQELVFEVYFEDTFMIADLYIDGAYDGRLAGQIDFNEDFVINRIGDDGTLLSCNVDTESIMGYFNRDTAPILNLISCETAKFEFSIVGMTPDSSFLIYNVN